MYSCHKYSEMKQQRQLLVQSSYVKRQRNTKDHALLEKVKQKLVFKWFDIWHYFHSSFKKIEKKTTKGFVTFEFNVRLSGKMNCALKKVDFLDLNTTWKDIV